MHREAQQPPTGLLDRLRRLAGYTWDESTQFRSSYGVWHTFGTKHLVDTNRSRQVLPVRPRSASSLEQRNDEANAVAPPRDARDDGGIAADKGWESGIEVVARISESPGQEEKVQEEYRSLGAVADSQYTCLLRPLEVKRLPSGDQEREPPLVVCIYESPGPNDLLKYVDCGLTWYRKAPKVDGSDEDHDNNPDEDGNDATSLRRSRDEPMPLSTFLDFAIGAAECIKILHSQQIVHGEIRADAFHFSEETGKVKLIHLGAGRRRYHSDLRNATWSALANQDGATARISYMSPEQTGRTPIQPDSRADIYSLGILLWSTLVQEAPFCGRTPMEIIRAVLGEELPLVSSLRPDVPDLIARVIAKATAKNVSERYHSVSGLRHDLVELRRLLAAKEPDDEDDDEGAAATAAELENWKIGSKDVSPFFTLPRIMVGRTHERNTIVEILDRTYQLYQAGKGLQLSALPEGQFATFDALAFPGDTPGEEDGHNAMEGFSSLLTSTNGVRRSYPANTARMRSPADSRYGSFESIESVAGSSDTRTADKRLSTPSIDSASVEGSSRSSDSAGRTAAHRMMVPKGRCELITIEGGAGLGKTRLITSVQIEARQRGFFASSRFDPAAKERLRPVLQLFSSLFEQAFSENTIEPSFLPMLRNHIGSAWNTLHKVLGLPKFLLESGPDLPDQASKRATATKFLRTGSSTKSLPLVRTLLDILRAFSRYKPLCLCLDDVHFADEESLELVAQIISARIRMVVILAYRPESATSEMTNHILDLCTNEAGFRKARDVGVTTITLSPLNEDSVMEYVANTLYLSVPLIWPLGALIQSRTGGNPFYIREMLSVCYRQKFVWYDYQEGSWSFDLRRISDHFKADDYHEAVLDDFLVVRLNSLPPVTKSILAWASSVGMTFSFQLVRRLLSGDKTTSEAGLPEVEMIHALQPAMEAYVIAPTKHHDVFSFTYNRYMHIAASFHTKAKDHVNFIKAQVLFQYYSHDDKYRNMLASAIIESAPVIKRSMTRRQPFRKFLVDHAKAANETGFRSTAVDSYACCIVLLQDNMWDDSAVDVSYDETLHIFTAAAECYLYQGQHAEADCLLQSILSHARNAVDKAPAWILQSRMLAQQGNSTDAFQALKACLVTLGLDIDEEPTFAKCDNQFRRLRDTITAIESEGIAEKTPVEHPNLAAAGVVLVEATRAAFWSDTLTFYQMTLVMVDTYLTRGTFPQAGMGLLQLAVIAISRDNAISFASHCGDLALALIEQWKDPHTMGRGIALYSTFVGHIKHPVQSSIAQLEGALDFAIRAGDRIATILNYGFLATAKFFASENLAELENFCVSSCEDIPHWQSDTPGGTILMAICQVCRALQGKTFTHDPIGVMSCEEHNSTAYKHWLVKTIKNSDRPLMLYESMEMAPLFLYGHYARAVALGNACLKKINAVWSARDTRFLMFFHSLSLAGLVWVRKQEQLERSYQAGNPQPASDVDGLPLDPSLKEDMVSLARMLRYFRRRIEQWQTVSDVNYLAWSKILGAQIAEMEGHQAAALRLYQEALDHASTHGFIFEEALAHHLLAGHLIREGSSRLGTLALNEAVTIYRRMGATGVADHILQTHDLQQRVKDAREAATQTDAEEMTVQTRPQVTTANTDDTSSTEDAVADRALHILDLTSILEASQVISSVLRVDELLRTMCRIIMQSCHGVATLAAIVTNEEQKVGWAVAASGNAAGHIKVHNPPTPIRQSNLVAESIVNYCVRFREAAYLPDVLQDPRFSHVSEAWVAQNPVSKSVMALPISPGGDESGPNVVLYLEGPPNAFSYRTRVVLQLLVVQLGISYSNALILQEVERVSTINQSMVEAQKKALAEAMAAEQKANVAKAEALHHAKLAEEAAKAKSSFLANISHELRTPLNGVIGNSELLLNSPLPEAQLEMAESIRMSANLLLAVINDILDFSKVEANKMQLHIVPFDVERMVMEVVRSVPTDSTNGPRSSNVHIVHDIQLQETRHVCGDPVRLRQILGNLLGNSLKFTERGTITVGARAENETQDSVRLSFWVADTGIGIPAALIPRLFRPFTQADASTARRFGGTGLGLSICKLLVELMGGTIDLKSTEHVGTTVSFAVTLPKAVPEDSGRTTPTRSSDGSQGVIDQGPPLELLDLSNLRLADLRVCIAEDNLINQKITVQFLKKLGFTQIDTYNNGLEAVEGIQKQALRDQPYHMILMDVQMPVMDGYDATRRLRQDPMDAVRRILIIALTASAIQGDQERCLASGMNDYLAKPVLLGALKKKFSKYLRIG
ncbi:two-component sensor protein histidine protein kinase [Aspergillus novofumigatus IBT 16806]|uniref:histidine kinase n=1 Tax=Aspergillus novofumigatus (strain IBT 16806) TaxID=1392255 RepID=A0A2I1CJN4_ASPN1|nr:two-component sensor protein histidine protein kinase [Aspergillus novofumigatus IBT 16806]PKX97816.1 two-component sensor protein histidine protein kinase [Aspergillus novofumigatus IBT 16806]